MSSNLVSIEALDEAIRCIGLKMEVRKGRPWSQNEVMWAEIREIQTLLDWIEQQRAVETSADSLPTQRLRMIADAAKDGASLTWIRAVAEEGLRGEPLATPACHRCQNTHWPHCYACNCNAHETTAPTEWALCRICEKPLHHHPRPAGHDFALKAGGVTP